MLDKLKELIKTTNPKQLGGTLKRDLDLSNWLLQATANIQNTITLSERAYLVLNGINSNICKLGNNKRFISFNHGYGFCGRAAECQCAKESVSQKVSTAKNEYSLDKKKRINDKRSNTNQNKYGVANAGQTSQAIAKHKEFYNNDLAVQEQINKQKSTMIDRYGVDNAMKLTAIKEKARSTVRERYGVDNINQLPESKIRLSENSKKAWEKRKSSKFDYNKLSTKFRELCNVEFLTKPEEYLGTVGQIHYDFQCNTCKTTFSTWISCGHLPICKTCFPTVHSFKSGEENEVFDYIKQLGISAEQRNRSLINPYELDIVCHDQRIAIEYCGLYWHAESSHNKQQDYHIKKMKLCEQKGYRLITIFSDEWTHKKEIVKNKLKNIFGVSNNRIAARKCKIIEVDTISARKFYEDNHLQGYTGSKIHIGLSFDNELVACMSFGLARAFTNNKTNTGEYELLRYASSKTVQGGASKLLRAFENKYSPSLIFSYADARWSRGNMYDKLGFKIEHIPSKPGYWYTNDYATRHHRFNFTKKSLVADGTGSGIADNINLSKYTQNNHIL